MKQKTAGQQLIKCRQGILKSIERWKSIKENGCNDPFWTDGCNMNLVRNYIIYDKHELYELCTREGLELPEEYFLSAPPEVDNNYMANLRQRERVERLRQYGYVLVTKSVDYDETQMCLF